MKLSNHTKPIIKFVTSPESPHRIYSFLEDHPSGVLATTGPSHNPHAAVVYYHIAKNFEVTFATKTDTKKHENMQHNKNVVLVVYDAFTQTTVQVIGVVEAIIDAKETRKVLRYMIKSAAETSQEGEPPLSKLYAGNYEAFKIIPKTVHMAMFLRPDPGGYDLFETIQFE